MHGAPHLAAVKARSGAGVGSQRGALHRPKRTAAKCDPCLRALGMQRLWRTAQGGPCRFSAHAALQPPGQLLGTEVITFGST